MIKTGLHCNYWYGIVDGEHPEAFIERTAEAGGEALDFSTAFAVKMDIDALKRFRRRAQSLGVTLCLNGGASGADLSNIDPDIRKRGVEACKRVIRVAAELGCRVWSGVIYAPWLGMPSGAFTRALKTEMWARAVDSLRLLCADAEAQGVDICLEIVNRFEAYMLNTAADGIRFAEDVGRGSLKLLLDMFHMNIEEDSAVGALSAALDKKLLGHVHISESNRRLPGLKRSDIPWRDVLSCLTDHDYDGAVILESFVLSSSPAANSFRTWRDMTDRPDAEGLMNEARISLEFVRSMLLGA